MDKLNRIHERAKEALDKIRLLDGCVCYDCQNERLWNLEEMVHELMYPNLPKIPPYMLSAHEGAPYELLNDLCHLRRRNVMIRKKIVNDSKNEILIYCDICGTLERKNISTTYNDITYCGSCWDRVFICSDCGSLQKRNTRSAVYDIEKNKHKYVCYTCFHLNYEYCVSCSRGYLREVMITYNVTHNLQRGRDPRTIAVCPKCNKKGLKSCTECGTITHYLAVRDPDKVLCYKCEELNLGLMPYYFKPAHLYFHRGKNEGKVSENAFHMGFELEVARIRRDLSSPGPEKMAKIIKTVVGKEYVYCVEDGSITRETGFEGLEIASHPFTWQSYKEDRERWDAMLLYLRMNGWKASLKGLGFHIHTTKAAWGNHQVYKLLKFIYLNQNYMRKIAQRIPNTYCVVDDDEFNQAVLIAKDKKNRNKNHYSAVNLNDGKGESSNTIEFRMFQSSLEPLFIQKNLEFTYACYRFTRERVKMNTREFNLFVTVNRREFPCLHHFVKEMC